MMTEIPRKWNRVISLFFFMEHPQGPGFFSREKEICRRLLDELLGHDPKINRGHKNVRENGQASRNRRRLFSMPLSAVII